MIALLATIGGAQGWFDIETYGVSHERWLSNFLALPFGIPSSYTYRRLFEKISPSSLERSFKSWPLQFGSRFRCTGQGIVDCRL